MANTKVTGDLIASSTIATGNIADNAVTSDKISGITTAHITEGSNLYYTDARADARITAASTSDLSEGTNLYYTDARADARAALIVDSAPATLDTLNELAAALGDDPNFATTTANSIGTKMPLAGGTFTGNVTLSSTAPLLYLANTTSSTGKTWRVSSAANGNAYITQDGVIDAITLSKQAGIDKIVLIGAYQGYKIIPFLKQHDIPVLVQQTHALPKSADDHYDLPYKLPKLLVEGGLLVGLQNSSMSNFQTRNLPFYAGQLVGQGMDKETALQLISGNTAKILGLDKYGTLELGKSATLFISEGDALDMMGNNLSRAFIDGRDISLETHQTELWKRYMGKYNQK